VLQVTVHQTFVLLAVNLPKLEEHTTIIAIALQVMNVVQAIARVMSAPLAAVQLRHWGVIWKAVIVPLEQNANLVTVLVLNVNQVA
jgi:hypothetical protein